MTPHPKHNHSFDNIQLNHSRNILLSDDDLISLATFVSKPDVSLSSSEASTVLESMTSNASIISVEEEEDRDDLTDGLGPLSSPSASAQSTLDQVLEAMDQQKWTPLKELLELHCASRRLVNVQVRLTCQGETEQGTLLHRVLLQSPSTVPVSVVELLLKTDDRIGQATDSKGKRLPLHMCLLKGCSVLVTDCILKAYPEGTLQIDDQGNLPLHYAAMYQNHHGNHSDTERLFLHILKANPAAAKKANHRERWPLHLLAASCWLGDDARPVTAAATTKPVKKSSSLSSLRHSSASSLKHLASSLSASSASLSTHTRTSANSQPEDTCYVIRNIQSCIDAYPQALQLPDRTGNTPLHLACNQAFLRHDVLKTFIDAFPEALIVQTKTRFTPYQLAERTTNSSYSLLLQYLKECTHQQRKKVSKNPLVRWNMAPTRRRKRRVIKDKSAVDLYHCYG